MRALWIRCNRFKVIAVFPFVLPSILEERNQRNPETGKCNDGSNMPCPKCEKQFEIPRQGLSGLRHNTFAERLLRIKIGLCDVCSDDQKIVSSAVPSAVKYCPLCCQGLCERCTTEHQRQKLSKSHQLKEVTDRNALKLIASKVIMASCGEHPEVNAQTYCSTCDQIVCVVCFLDRHASHRRLTLEEALDKSRDKMQETIECVSELLTKVIETKHRFLENQMVQMDEKTSDVENQIRMRSIELKQLIDSQERRLLSDIKCRKQKFLEEIEQKANSQTEISAIQLRSRLNYCKELKEFGSYEEISSILTDLQNSNAREHSKMLPQMVSESYLTIANSCKFTFHAAEFKVENIFGTITSNKVRIQLDTKGKDAWGAAWLNNIIYILTQKSILTYADQYPFEYLNEISMDGKGYLSDLAACPTSNRLYVADQGDGPISYDSQSCIWKVNIHENNQSSESYSVTRFASKSSKGKFQTLSVTSDGFVITAMQFPVNKLRIYDMNARLLKSLSLADIRYANHAIAIDCKTFAVAYGKLGERNGICRVESENSISHHLDYLDHPWHLAVYRDNEVLVADSKNDRILLLNSDLQLKGELLTKGRDEIGEPRRLCYVKERKSLIVVHGEKGTQRKVDLFHEDYWSA